MILMIDNYDSFVYNLVRYFEELDEEVIIYRNDKITLEDIEKLELTGIVISPGPKSPSEAGLSLDIIDRFKDKLPILGICLGHQCIGYYFGAKVVKGIVPIHGKTSYIEHNGIDLFSGVKNPLRVTRYHSLVVQSKDLPSEIIITSSTEDGVIMGLKHKEYPIYGLQFHPEAEMTDDGHKLLQNFIMLTKNYEGRKDGNV